jgi:F-type H+-transporting ATPase subunit gamma
MAGASMNDIKARMKSVSSTMQITKAMELVATSKLRRAKENVERARPFYEILGQAINNIRAAEDFKETVFGEVRNGGKSLYIVIAGDRGLAGGYNTNIFKMTEVLAKNTEAVYLPIGKKALDYYKRRNREIINDSMTLVSNVGVGDSHGIAKAVCQGFLSGEYNRVYLVYTKFISMISQRPVYEQLLPLEDVATDNKKAYVDPIIEEDPEELLLKILPQYVGGILYSAICEALASESGARRSAMNSANKNAKEMIDMLMLKYNRARQAVITQEITEIVSGAEAL